MTSVLTTCLLGAACVSALCQDNSSPSAGAADKYVLNPMDKLRYRIEQDPVKVADLEVLSVSALNEVDFPVSRGSAIRVTVNTRGKTLAEVKAELKAKLDEEYYYNASIDLRLLDRTQKSGQVLIYGAVRNNVVPLAPGEQKTLLEAVLQAGPSEFARLTKVKLHRFNPATQKSETQVVDVESIKKSGDKSKDISLRDGDRIEVPERGIVF